MLKSLMRNGTDILTYQHGGNIGLYDFNTFEWYQNLISTKANYWFDDASKFKFNKSIKRRISSHSKFSVIIVLVSIPRFNYYVHGFPLSDNYQNFCLFRFK